MASFTTKFLKKRFAKPKDLQAYADRVSPGLALFNKPEQGGASVAEPVISSGPQGFSYSLPAAQAVSAQADRGASVYDEFNSTFGEYHGSAVLSARAVAGGKTDQDAYLRQLTEVMISSIRSFGAIAARKVWGPVGGAIGKITLVNGGGSNGELTLSLRADTFNIFAGMILQAADSNGNGIPANVRAGLGFVMQVFPDGDTDTTQVRVATSEALRVAGTVGLPSGWANNDFLFRNGDIAAALDLSDLQIRSLQSWITLLPDNTALFNGVNRSQDARLSGFRLAAGDVGGLSQYERALLLVNEGRASCGAMDVDVLAVGPRTWQQMVSEASSYGEVMMGQDAKLGFSYITLNTANGPVKVINDPFVQEADMWALTSADMMIYNYDGFPALDDFDGVELLRQTSSAAYEVRYHAFTCLTVNGKPFHFGRASTGN